MTFTYDWFSGNIPNWSKWLCSFKGRPARALEIGCFEGLATTWMLQNILTHDASTITVVDTFGGSEEHKVLGLDFSTIRKTFEANIKPWSKKVSVFVGKSGEVVRHFTGPFDFAYIDGSHESADVLMDACLVWPILNAGGIMIFDDYAWDGFPDPAKNPRLGIDAFLATFGNKCDLISIDYQVCIRKPML